MFRQSRTNVELFRLRSSNFGFSIVSSKCGLISSALDPCLMFQSSRANIIMFWISSVKLWCFESLERLWIYLERAQPIFLVLVETAPSNFGQVSTVLDQNLMLGPSWANVDTFRQLATKFWCLDSLGQMWICFDRARSSFDVSTVSNKCGVVSTALEFFWYFDCLERMWVNFVRARPIFIVSNVPSDCGIISTVLNQLFCLDHSEQLWTSFVRAWLKFDAWIALSKCVYVSTVRD